MVIKLDNIKPNYTTLKTVTVQIFTRSRFLSTVLSLNDDMARLDIPVKSSCVGENDEGHTTLFNSKLGKTASQYFALLSSFKCPVSGCGKGVRLEQRPHV